MAVEQQIRCKVCNKELSIARIKRIPKDGRKCRACVKHKRSMPNRKRRRDLTACQVIQLCREIIARASQFNHWRQQLREFIVLEEGGEIIRQELYELLGMDRVPAYHRAVRPLIAEVGLELGYSKRYRNECWVGGILNPDIQAAKPLLPNSGNS